MKPETANNLVDYLYQLLAIGEDLSLKVAAAEEVLKEHPIENTKYQKALDRNRRSAGSAGVDSALEDLRSKLLLDR